MAKSLFDRQVGQKLREARLRHRLSVDQVATKLRVPPKYLFALEEGNLSVFSAEVYAKGAYTKYASYLNVNTSDSWHAFLRALADARQTTPLRLPVLSTWLQRILTPAGFFFALATLIVLLVASYISLQINAFISVPNLRLILPDSAVITSDDIIVKGLTEAGAEVSINREPVLLNQDNQFTYRLPLSSGINVLRVEAVGASGRTNVIEKHLLVPRSQTTRENLLPASLVSPN